MLRVALRGIRAHLVRFVLSVLAVALGVAFVAGTFALRTMLSSTFDGIIASSMRGDAYVRGADRAPGESTIGAESSDARNQVPLSLVESIEGVEGVSAALPDLTGPAVLVGADGTAVQSTQAPSFALVLYPQSRGVELLAGHLPEQGDQVALEHSTLEASGLALGDTTTVVLGGQLQQVQVVGDVQAVGMAAGATLVYVDPATGRALFAPDGKVATIAVNGERGVSEQTLVDRLEPVVRAAAPPDAPAQAVTGDAARAESRAAIEAVLGFVLTFLLVFAAISLFVGAFIIANTFSMSVRQRMREFALLRAVGASPAQVFASILLQAAVVGVIGSALGVVGGLALVEVLRLVLRGAGMNLAGSIPLDAQTVTVSLLVGTLVSIVAAYVPARRAALVPPVEAMRDETTVPERSLRRRAITGSVLGVLGVAGVVAAVLRPSADRAPQLLGYGAAGVVLGMVLLSPVIARASIGVLAVPFVAALRPIGRLARGNVVRNPRRTANTAGALMIGMALVGAAAVIASSTTASTRAIVAREATTDFILSTPASGTIPIDAVTAVRALPDVAAADAFYAGQVLVHRGGGDQSSALLAGIDPATVGRSLQVEDVDGDLRTALAAGEVAVQRGTAKDEGWAVGDRLTLVGASGERELRVGAVIDSSAIPAPLVVSPTDFDALVPATARTIPTVFVTATPGTDLHELRDQLTQAVKPFVVVSVLDTDQFVAGLADQVNQVLVILYALLGLSVVIAVLGIVNTLALSVIERTREIGLLRAVGLGRLQLAGTVTIESVLTAVFGTVVGLAVGVALASTMPTVFADDGLSDLGIPWASLAAMVVLAVVVGVLAAVWPAIRAARLPVLDAVSYE
ncbi:ABC transporter permease [Cellulomonas sp. P22]|uniref:ABC transporter permease n=1 Tax=Cellulomonas sp. P22 TaxID=3373189 RepID=UPI0037B9093F